MDRLTKALYSVIKRFFRVFLSGRRRRLVYAVAIAGQRLFPNCGVVWDFHGGSVGIAGRAATGVGIGVHCLWWWLTVLILG